MKKDHQVPVDVRRSKKLLLKLPFNGRVYLLETRLMDEVSIGCVDQEAVVGFGLD